MKRTIVCAILLFAAASIASAVPNVIGYQGYLERDGQPVTGDVSMSFYLYPTATGGLWFFWEKKTVHVDNGVYFTYLGDVVTLPTLPVNGCWLEVTVHNPDMTLKPRQFLASAPYALTAVPCLDLWHVNGDTALTFTAAQDGLAMIYYGFELLEVPPGTDILLRGVMDDTLVFINLPVIYRSTWYWRQVWPNASWTPVTRGQHHFSLYTTPGPSQLVKERTFITIWTAQGVYHDLTTGNASGNSAGGSSGR